MTATERKWSERVREWRESGQTAQVFSRGRGFPAGTLHYWAHQLKKQGSAEASTATKARAKRKAPARVRVVRLARIAESSAPAVLTVEVGTARLCISAGVDPVTLRATFAALFAAIEGGR